MAIDSIHAAGMNRNRCGILDTDLIAAYCNMVSTWCFSVMARKGLDPDIETSTTETSQ